MIDEVAPSAARDTVDGRSATPLVVGLVIIALAVVVYFATGMPGMDHSQSTTNHDMLSHVAHRIVDPVEFEAVLADPITVTINVHVPAVEVQINGTDLTMPFDDLDDLDAAELPSNRDTALAVYCRSGAMSGIAVRHLLALGYTDIVELDGGTDARAASDR